MARYARSLSVLGFILMAWSVYKLVYFYGFVGLRPPWIINILTILGFLHLVGALVLLRRLARPAPAGNVVRRLARFWIILSLCSLGLAFWAIGKWPPTHISSRPWSPTLTTCYRSCAPLPGWYSRSACCHRCGYCPGNLR